MFINIPLKYIGSNLVVVLVFKIISKADKAIVLEKYIRKLFGKLIASKKI